MKQLNWPNAGAWNTVYIYVRMNCKPILSNYKGTKATYCSWECSMFPKDVSVHAYTKLWHIEESSSELCYGIQGFCYSKNENGHKWQTAHMLRCPSASFLYQRELLALYHRCWQRQWANIGSGTLRFVLWLNYSPLPLVSFAYELGSLRLRLAGGGYIS